jgi:hypothetical protein
MTQPGADDLPPVVRPQRQQRRFAQWPLAVVLGCMLGSLLVVAGGRFRVGTLLIAGALLLGAFLRATLPERSAGLLAVLTLGSLGAAVLLLALIVPNPR